MHPPLDLLGALARQFGRTHDRALLEHAAARATRTERLDLLAALARTPARIPDEIGRLGRHALLRAIPCAPPDRCFEGADDSDRPIFVRTFPRERLTDALIVRHRRWAELAIPGLAKLVDFGVVEHQPFVLAEHVPGLSLVELAELQPSLPIVLALLFDGLAILRALHQAGAVHGHLSPGRIRVEPLGAIRLCLGTSDPVATPANPGRDLCVLARSLLGLATRDALVLEVLATDEPDALSVAADRLQELHPAHAELIQSVLGGRAPAAEVAPHLAGSADPEEALRIIEAVVAAARGSAPD